MHVILVHGMFDHPRTMGPMRRHLAAAGHTCHAPQLTPRDARRGLAPLGEQLERFIAAAIGPEERFALVGFSMGALIGRRYLQEREGHRRVDAFFSIAGPHAGTLLAFLYPGVGAREMRPGSALLRQLSATASAFAHIPTVCYWSPFDLMILPSASTRLPRAEHVRISSPLHPLLVFSRRVHRDIAARLARFEPNSLPSRSGVGSLKRSHPPAARPPRENN